MYVNVWSSSTMLVLRLLWTYGLLMIFMIRSISSAPTNGSLPITIKLKEQLATKYGGLLKALISVNEQRLDVLQKLQRLQDLPVTVLRTKGPEVYAVWKLDTKPTLIEELLRERAHLIETHSRNLAALIIVTDKAKSEESSSLEFGKGSPEIEVSDEEKENIIDATITTTEKPKNEESSSLEFWEPSQEVLHSDGEEEKGINNIIDVPITTTENPKSEESSSLEYWEPSQEVLHSNGDEKEETNIIDVPIATTEKTKIEESGSLEYWKGSQEILDSNESDEVEDEIMNFREPTELVEKNLIIVPYLSPLSGSLEFFEASQEMTKKYKDLRRYKYAKDCSKKATKYCKIACKEAFKKMCGRFKCTSEVKRNYKKQCHYMCLEEFVTDSEYFEC